jgi:hypothetical protein
LTIEFVDVPAEPAPPEVGAAVPHVDHAPSRRAPSKVLTRADRTDGGARSVQGRSGGGAVLMPEPSGTAAFGSARD